MTDLIKDYLIVNFAQDLTRDTLSDDYDLIASGVIDSLALLRVITWLSATYDIDVDEVELSEDHFVSVSAIRGFVENATSSQQLAA